MTFKTTTKLYFLILSFSFLLLSCVSNEDEKPTEPVDNRPVLDLTNENLAGTWELYYFTKRVIEDTQNGRDRDYRFTEEDGFSVTFNEDGTYYEQNVFKGITQKGTYTLGKKSPASKKNDYLTLNFKTSAGEDTTTYANIPGLYKESFMSYFSYWGPINNSLILKLADSRYYRNVKKAPDYLDKAFKKNNITEKDLIGNGQEYWEFYRYEYQQDREFIVTSKKKPISSSIEKVQKATNALGESYRFRIEDDSLRFYQYAANDLEVAEMRGLAKITDDVVNMKWEGWITVEEKDEEGNIISSKKEWKVKSFKWWIKHKDEISDEGLPAMINYDEYRELKDDKHIAESTYYQKKSVKPTTRSYTSTDGKPLPVKSLIIEK